MKIHWDGSRELSLIPETDQDRSILQSLMVNVENDLLDASMDGVNLDELVLSQACDEGGSHCRLCGQRRE